jgi:DNA-binding transcriptional ArsR family regulator
VRHGPDLARLAALIGDPARANMLAALMGGMALTAGKLAAEAGVTKQTASGHLARLGEAGLLAVAAQGRHRYYRLASCEVAEALESLAVLAAGHGGLRTRPGPLDPALRRARVCYDHLAGDLGVALYEALLAQRALQLDAQGLGLTAAGAALVAGFGVDVAALRAARRPLCRSCLDWSVRRDHLAGALGAAVLAQVFAHGWARRVPGSRAVAFTASGERAFAAAFGLALRSSAPASP